MLIRLANKPQTVAIVGFILLILVALFQISWFSGIGFDLQIRLGGGIPRAVAIRPNDRAELSLAFLTNARRPRATQNGGNGVDMLGIGFEYHAAPFNMLIVYSSYWLPMLICFLCAIISWKRYFRIARSDGIIRHCKNCDYDLRAHNPGDKCPECGTPIPPLPPAPNMGLG